MAEEITATTDVLDADRVVVVLAGIHGSAPDPNLPGSTAQRVGIKSTVPVTVVPISGETE